MRWRRWRLVVGPLLFLVDELVLFGAAEGMQKTAWMEVGSLLNILLTLGFMF